MLLLSLFGRIDWHLPLVQQESNVENKTKINCYQQKDLAIDKRDYRKVFEVRTSQGINIAF